MLRNIYERMFWHPHPALRSDTTRVHVSCWSLKFECRETRLHAARRAAFYGLFVVETKLITPRGSRRIVAFASFTPYVREGAAFLLNHTSRVLVVARLICRDAFFCGAEPSREREREKEKGRETCMGYPYFMPTETHPCMTGPFLFSRSPREWRMLHAFDVDGSIWGRRRVFEPECRVSENLLPQNWKIFILTATTGILFSPTKDTSMRFSDRRLLSTFENCS